MLDSIIKIEVSASAVAWYGAIVATASLLIILFGYLRDRAKIKVRLSQGFLVYDNQLGDQDQVFIEAINVGRRTVTLNGAGFLLNNGMKMTMMDPQNIRFPYELEEGKSIQVYTEKVGLFRDAEKMKAKITHAWCRDETGRTYKTRFRLTGK